MELGRLPVFDGGNLPWTRIHFEGVQEAEEFPLSSSSSAPGESVNADIAVDELHRRRTSGESVHVLDVRQPEEVAVSRIEGSQWIPLMDLSSRMNELDPDEEIVVYCKMGGRSSQAAAFLRAQGFRNVRNLTGGIHAWIDKVDPTMRKG
jgi:adenylyltransferase/sulfurtransferase